MSTNHDELFEMANKQKMWKKKIVIGYVGLTDMLQKLKMCL